MLAYKVANAWLSWSGEAVNGTHHPTNIEQLWSDAELANAGFARIVQQPVPTGKQATAWVLNDLAGVPTQVPTLQDIAPPETITDRQFFQQLATQGIITQDEALAAVGPGTLPAKLADLIGQLPPTVQFDAKMKAIGAVQYQRSSALVNTIAGLFGWDAKTTDAFWSAASAL